MRQPSTAKGQQVVHQNSSNKSISSKIKGAKKQTMHCPGGTPCHTTSKGGRENPQIALPRVAEASEADYHVVQIFASRPMPQLVVLAHTTRSQSWPPQVHAQSSMAQPNYISQDDDDNPPYKMCTTRSSSTSKMQEAMLSCNDISKPTFTISAAQLSQCKLLMKWQCNMANLVLATNGKLLE